MIWVLYIGSRDDGQDDGLREGGGGGGGGHRFLPAP